MSIWNTSHTWQVMALLTALLTLSSCASTSPTIQTSETPTFGDFPTSVTTTGPTPSPYRPSSQAAQAIRECAPSAVNGGCYTAEQIQTFYDLNPLYAKGYNGKGSTIIILDPYGSSTIKH